MDQDVNPVGTVNPTVVNLHQLTTNVGYVFASGVTNGLLVFERSVGMGYTYSGQNPFSNNLSFGFKYSLSDYVMPAFSVNYRFALPNVDYPGVQGSNAQFLAGTGSLTLQSPSRCWRLVLNASYAPGVQGLNFAPDFSLNLIGTGFGGVADSVGSAARSSGS